MADKPEAGSAPVGKRTFDCPWCGAITVIPVDHLGEHFACPECKKGTKLTKKNTNSGKPTAPPPDAPHLSGDRTFDCPWCSLISSISAAYVGEHFKCPECKRSTKITETNTTRAGVTVAPGGATPSSGKKGLIAVAVLAVVGVGVWLGVSSASSSGDGKGKEPKESASAPPFTGPEVPRPESVPPEAMATEPPVAPESTSPTPAGTPAVPVAPPAPPAVKSPELLAAAKAAVAAAQRLEDAKAAVAAAQVKLAQWVAANPDTKDTVLNLETLHALIKETERMRAGLDPVKATPDQVRGFNVGVMTYVMSDAKRVHVAESLLSLMKADLHGRHVLGLEWTGLDFHGPAFERAVKDMEVRWLTAPATPSELRKAVADAEAAVTQAQQDSDAAAKAVLDLENPVKAGGPK